MINIFYQILKSKKVNILASLEYLKGSPMLKACLNRPLYSLLEFKPKNLKNPILNFEYISLIFLIFQKFFINF